MAAYYFHRKILEIQEVNCTAQCDPVTNPTGLCAPICYVICSPAVCNNTALYLIPLQQPPAPPTESSVYSTPLQHHHSSLSLPLKISLVILVITFSLFLLYTLYKFYTVWYRSRRRRSQPPSPETQETHDEFLDHDVLDHPIWYIRTIGLQPSVISAITVVKYNKSDGLIDDTYCSVCLTEFEEDETLRLLPKCNHAFHVSCIDTWLRSHTNCPLCRAGIVKNTTNSSTAGQNTEDSGQMVETQLSISIPEEADREETQEGSENSELRETIGGIATPDFVIMRRSVSLNDNAACGIRSDVHTNYCSDRHELQIRPLDGDLGFEVIKVEQTSNIISGEGD